MPDEDDPGRPPLHRERSQADGSRQRGDPHQRTKSAEPRQHRRMLGQQREIDAAPADRLEQREQTSEYRFGLDGRRSRRGGGGAQELRQKRVEALPRQGRQLQITRALPHAGERLDQLDG